MSQLFFGTLIVLVASALVFFGAHVSQASDFYERQTMVLEGNPIRGSAIFQINCAGCHGSAAYGDVGPSLHMVALRKSDARLIQQVTSGSTPPMPKFQPAPQEMADLLSYLHTLR